MWWFVALLSDIEINNKLYFRDCLILDLVNIIFRLVLRNIQKNVYYMATV